jgi:ATP-binding cassette, subfamily C (CFTR/MRP), member 1
VTSFLLVIIESLKKTRFLRPGYKEVATAETTTNFWARSFFTWVLPFFREGYGKILGLRDIPRVDAELEEERAWRALNETWRRGKVGGRYKLIKAVGRANVWTFAAAVPPRVALAVFGFAQPFLIESAVRYLQVQERNGREGEEVYGHALVGGFVLAYLGIAVGSLSYWNGCEIVDKACRSREQCIGVKPTA